MEGAASKGTRIGRLAIFAVGAIVVVALTFGLIALILTSMHFGADSTLARVRPPKTAYAHVLFTAKDGEYFDRSRGVIDVAAVETSGGRIYCFDLTFVPKVAAAAPFINNNAVIGVTVAADNAMPNACESPNRDAAAKTYAANTSEVRADIAFTIIFH